jgi:hypothetical protein
MWNKRTKHFTLPVLAALAFVTLILTIARNEWMGLTLRNEVRPFEAITLATNLLIAFYIQRYFATRMNDLRAEKNILIEFCKNTIKLIDEARYLTDPLFLNKTIDEDSSLKILSSYRRVANSLTELEEGLNLCDIQAFRKSVQPLWEDFFALKMAATGDSFPSKGYAVEQRASQDRLYRTLVRKLRILIFEINNARA